MPLNFLAFIKLYILMIKKFPSKVSYGLLVTVFIVFFTPLFLNYIYCGVSKNMILMSLFLILIFSLIMYMFLNTEYTIETYQLKIRCGFFKYKPIAISDIKEIKKSSNIISSPAASFDRIEIKYGKFDEIIISPKHKNQFAECLTNLNPKIKNYLN